MDRFSAGRYYLWSVKRDAAKWVDRDEDVADISVDAILVIADAKFLQKDSIIKIRKRGKIVALI